MPPKGIAPAPAEGREAPDEPHQGKLEAEVRREHGAEHRQKQEEELRPGIKAAHFVIPAFSNCFFSIRPPTKVLSAAASTVPSSMASRIPVVPVIRMVSM